MLMQWLRYTSLFIEEGCRLIVPSFITLEGHEQKLFQIVGIGILKTSTLKSFLWSTKAVQNQQDT